MFNDIMSTLVAVFLAHLSMDVDKINTSIRKGTNGVSSTDGATAKFRFFDRGTFRVPPLTYFDIPSTETCRVSTTSVLEKPV